ncbi:MAG: glycosyltransferase family 2 protein [Isosphaeraceae bacterium]
MFADAAPEGVSLPSIDVDVLILTRDGRPPRATISNAVASQRGVWTRLHVVAGAPVGEDPNRWATIARARNAARCRGDAPLVLFLDDDVALGPDCLATLVEGLTRRPDHAALAANYLGEDPRGRHVAMGATLFRREVLAFLEFRWEPGRCECQCACDDLRAHGFGIGYEPSAVARHEPDAPRDARDSSPRRGEAPRVLAAFDQNHARKFRRQFLPTLRASGNRETVTVVGYGLDPLDRRLLAGTEGVELIHVVPNGVHPAIRRLRDFPTILSQWPPETPVAYWDAGDVAFQSPLGPLWTLVRAHPGKLLVVREPSRYPENGAVAAWTLGIHDPVARLRVFRLLASRPFFNAGFAAGDAKTLIRYFREADRLLHSSTLAGSGDWGDQTAFNLYCHDDPSRYREVAIGWNYCLHDRAQASYVFSPEGLVRSTDGQPVHVVHGNASSYRQLDLAHVWE